MGTSILIQMGPYMPHGTIWVPYESHLLGSGAHGNLGGQTGCPSKGAGGRMGRAGWADSAPGPGPTRLW